MVCVCVHVVYVLGPVWLKKYNRIWILISGSWNHGVVIKQNVKSESGFLKTIAKSGISFLHSGPAGDGRAAPVARGVRM